MEDMSSLIMWQINITRIRNINNYNNNNNNNVSNNNNISNVVMTMPQIGDKSPCTLCHISIKFQIGKNYDNESFVI